MWRSLSALILMLAAVAGAQTDQSIQVKDYPGANVGAKLQAAMVNCPGADPCILIIDASLANAAAGTMPALCATCVLEDFRGGGLLTKDSPPDFGALRVKEPNTAPGPEYAGLFVAGDSVSSCYGTTSTAKCWPNQAAQSVSGGLTNVAAGGAQAADGAMEQVFPGTNPSYAGASPAYVLEFAGNDATGCGTSTGCEGNYYHTMLAMAGWLAIPNEAKILMGSNTVFVATTGTWAEDSRLQANLALETVTAGSTLTFSLPVQTSSLILAWMATDENTSSAALSCGNGITDTLVSSGYGHVIQTQLGETSTVFANIYTPRSGFAAGTTCTVTAANVSTSNPFSLVFAGWPTPTAPNNMTNITYSAPALFIVGNTYRPASAGQQALDPCMAAYDPINYQIASQLAAAGMFVKYVPLRQPAGNGVTGPLNNTTDYACTAGMLPYDVPYPASTACGHPNDMGAEHIADAFLEAAKPIGGMVGGAFSNMTQQGQRVTCTLSWTDGVDYCNTGSAFTLPTSGWLAGHTYLIENGTSGALSFSGASGPIAGASLPPGQSMLISSGDAGGNWSYVLPIGQRAEDPGSRLAKRLDLTHVE